MAFELPELVQRMRLDTGGWTGPLAKATNDLEAYARAAGQRLVNVQAVDAAQAKFEELAASVTNYAKALGNADRDVQAFVGSYARQIGRIKSVLDDPTTRAGLVNRTKAMTLAGLTPDAADVSRMAKATIDAHQKAAAQVDAHFRQHAVENRFNAARNAGAGMPGQIAAALGLPSGVPGLGPNLGMGARSNLGLGLSQPLGLTLPTYPSAAVAPAGFGALAAGALGGAVAGGISLIGSGVGMAIDAGARMIDNLIEKVKEFSVEAIKAGAALERWRVTFDVMSGGVGRGTGLFNNLMQMARETPFNFDQLADASQVLLGMGVRAENLVAIMSRLGDVAAGDAGRLKRLAVVFGEVEAEGKLTGWRVRQLASLGIGIADMAQTMGVPPQAFRALMSANVVPGDILAKTLERLTNPGGRFGEMNKNVLATFSGQFNRAENVVQQLMGKAGEAFLGSSGLAGRVGFKADWLASIESQVTAVGTALGRLAGKVLDNFEGVEIVISRAFGGNPTKSLEEGIDRMTAGVDRFVDKVIDGAEAAAMAAIKTGKVLDKYIVQPTKFAFSITHTASEAIKNTPGAERIQAMLAERQGAAVPPPEEKFILDWARDLRNRPRGGLAGNRGEFIPAPPKPLLRDMLHDHFALSGPAQELYSQLWVGGMGGKAKGFGADTPLHEFQREMASLNEIEMKGYYSSMARTAGGLAAGGLVAGGAILGALNNSPYAYATNQNLGVLQGAMKFVPPDLRTPEGATDERRFQGFLKLRQAFGGNVSDHLPTVAEYGSAEALDTINKTNSDNRSVLEEMLSVAQAALDSDRQRAEIQREFSAAFKQLPAELARFYERGEID